MKPVTGYRLFASEDHDWYVLAYLGRHGANVKVLYQGHSREQAYEAMITDMGHKPPKAIERDMENGSYVPVASDWA